VQKKATPLIAADVNLPAGNKFVAAGADAALIKRRPLPTPIAGAQNLQAIFQGEMLLHA
jgi:hypothetical protein